jgi:hypothetical protein
MTPAAAVAEAARTTEDITSLRYRLSGTTPGEGRGKGEASKRLKLTTAMSMKVTAPDERTTEAMEKSWIKFDLSGSEAAKEVADLAGMFKELEQG